MCCWAIGYRIPYGQARDLRSPTARLDPAAIEQSRAGGSIARRLRQGVLAEMEAIVPIAPPAVSVAEPSAISFPQRAKSLVVPEGGDLADSVQSAVVDEDEELLRQMEADALALAEGEAAGLPVSVDPAKASALLDRVSGGCCGGKRRA